MTISGNSGYRLLICNSHFHFTSLQRYLRFMLLKCNFADKSVDLFGYQSLVMAHSIAYGTEPWVTFLWNIENFSYCSQKEKEYINSPQFIVESTENTVWNIWLYPRGKNDEKFISFVLYGSWSNEWIRIKVKCDIALLAEDGSVLKITDSKVVYFRANNTLLFDLFAERKEVTKTRKEAFLSSDTLRIRCRLWRNHVKIVEPATISARSVLPVEKKHFLWDIERFSSLEFDEKLYYFILSESKEQLAGFKIGVNKEGNVMIYMKHYAYMRYFIFQIFITDTNGSRIDLGKCETWPHEVAKEEQYLLSFTKKNVIEKKNLYMKNDVLSLYCEFSWTNGSVYNNCEKIDTPSLSDAVIPKPTTILSGISNSIIPKPNTTSSCINNTIPPKECASNTEVEEMNKMVDLKEDMEYLYAESILCDVKLCTTNETFPAHKAFLCARSPVFRKMFTTDMKEKVQECVDIPDLEDDTVRRMLLYVYTNTLEGLQWESALKLYAVADKYEMAALKSKCSSFLKRNLCPGNLCDVLILADIHVDGDLKGTAQDYVLKHEEEVFHSEEWEEFVKTNTALASETMFLKWKKK
ncbi:hypothetical protein NPIL_4211 [Nephila pilipes]|uniref:Uncharacterized protein n=1 Tax=Nephila pilipes TaxID=299642 RepID=A0A8X6ISP4_NEPPI|nr:hypothetical protein NPIL_4211 [Nephila pilipes]